MMFSRKKSTSLRTRLLFSVLFTLIVSLFFTTLLSFLYFFRFIRIEAVNTLERNLHVSEVIYHDYLDQVSSLSRRIAENPTTQILTDLRIGNKLSQLMSEHIIDNPSYQITIIDSEGHVLTSLALSDSYVLEAGERIPLEKNEFLKQALNSASTSGTEELITEEGTPPLSLTAAHPIIRNRQVVGAVLVRNVINNDPTLIETISRLLDVQAALYSDAEIISASHDVPIEPDIYFRLVHDQDEYKMSDLWSKGRISHFSRITDPQQKPVGVLGVHVSAEKYIKIMLNASTAFLLIMLTFIAISTLVVIFLARSILNPINDLLNGVTKITDGDLSHEIIISLKDEIGKLSEAFNEMRRALKDKISTIETMNASLEDTVKERTFTIESLLETMKKYLPAQLYEAIAGGERTNDVRFHYRKKLTVFFSDIVNFTSTTESMEAEDLSDLLNSYLDAMSMIATKWGGTLDKYIGDAVMIFFGDPEFTSDKDHALRAVRMAMEMLERMKSLRAEWAQIGIEKPLHIRIGLNTGYCTVGNFGSEDRMDYTIIGGNVNLAARFQAAAEPDTILISHETYSLIENEIQCSFAGEVKMKGITHPVRTYKVIGEKKKKASFQYLKVDENGIRFANSFIEPENMSPADRQELIRALTRAMLYTKSKMEKKEEGESRPKKISPERKPDPLA